jgi:hypothetical protein
MPIRVELLVLVKKAYLPVRTRPVGEPLAIRANDAVRQSRVWTDEGSVRSVLPTPFAPIIERMEPPFVSVRKVKYGPCEGSGEVGVGSVMGVFRGRVENVVAAGDTDGVAGAGVAVRTTATVPHAERINTVRKGAAR